MTTEFFRTVEKNWDVFVIGDFEVHESAIDAIIGWQPHYWSFLTQEMRQTADRLAIESFVEELLNSNLDTTTINKKFKNWFVYRAVSHASSRHWRLCLSFKEQREREVARQKGLLCGARKKDGEICQAYVVRGRNRCRFHGGASTGPKTVDGKIRSLSYLRQYRRKPELLVEKRKQLEAMLEA